MIEAGIAALLGADSTLTGLIGTRLFPVLVPEGQMPVKAGDPPCLSYQAIKAPASYTLEPKECDYGRIQFDAWGMLYSDCKSVKQAVRNILFGYHSTLTDGTRILSVEKGVEIDFWDEHARIYRVMFEYIFRFVEP